MKLMKLYWYFAFLILISIMVTTVFAIPGIPHQFKGTVTINGSPAPDGTIVDAVVEGDTFRTGSISGVFGTDPADPFFVKDPNGGRAGKTIEFFVDGTSVFTKTFENGVFTNLGNFDITREEPPPEDTGGPGPSGGPGGPSGSTSTNLLKVDKTRVEIGEEVTATVKCLWGFGCRLIIDGIEVKTYVYGVGWKDYTTSFDTAGEKVFSFERKGTGDTLIGSKTVKVIDPNPPVDTGEENGEENADTGANLCNGETCDDRNSCTIDRCSEGVCDFEAVLDGTPCGSNGECISGECFGLDGEPIDESGEENITPPLTPTGFFGVGGLPNFGLTVGLLVLALIITILGYSYTRKKKAKSLKNL